MKANKLNRAKDLTGLESENRRRFILSEQESAHQMPGSI
ncbi:hypothetical protein SynRS9907_01173 [Synechococcus sp. RS9907]|nr:hypothetical protein SynRS9907_01173 [Synechococcus sp. RS9907]